MARARNIKPSFFENEQLAKQDMRSFNSLLNKVLSDYCNRVEKKSEASK